jgi:hypothetical protein
MTANSALPSRIDHRCIPHLPKALEHTRLDGYLVIDVEVFGWKDRDLREHVSRFAIERQKLDHG